MIRGVIMTKESKKKKAQRKFFYFIKRESYGHRVMKVEELENGGVHKESEYRIEKSGCECKAFKFKGTCKHADMALKERLEGHPVDLSVARESIRRLIADFGEVFRSVELPAEPYERDEVGKVTCVTLNLHKVLEESEILSKGTWEGCLQENGLKVRLVID